MYEDEKHGNFAAFLTMGNVWQEKLQETNVRPIFTYRERNKDIDEVNAFAVEK